MVHFIKVNRIKKILETPADWRMVLAGLDFLGLIALLADYDDQNDDDYELN